MMPPDPLFHDRVCAGKHLATAIDNILSGLQFKSIQPIVYALPRGGVPVAAEVAQLLDCPLTIVLAKKISLPENPELAIGAVTADGQVLWSQEPIRSRLEQQPQAALSYALNKAQLQLEQLAPACPQVNPEGAIAILVDDGIATGMTIAVASLALRAQHPAEVWLCAPVAPLSLIPWLQQWGDRVILLETPQTFLSVSRFYREFPQVGIEEVLACLRQRK